MYYVSSFSGGISSAVATDRAIQRYGRERVVIWFADTSWEDEDLHRFKDDLMQRWGGEIITSCDGRTPLEVAVDEKIIPNQKLAPCSFRLKIDRFTSWLKAVDKPVTVMLGLDWTEIHRTIAPKRNYEKMIGVTVDFPLMWSKRVENHFDTVRSWGIKIPRLYNHGFSHNNCGGRCVRQGVRDWNRLRFSFPQRFAEVRNWEKEQRAKGGKLANYAICRDFKGGVMRPKTLEEIESLDNPKDGELVQEDMFACFCSY